MTNSSINNVSNIEDLRKSWELDNHWLIRKAVIETYKDNMPMDKLLCYAQLIVNVETLGVEYSKQVMETIKNLADNVDYIIKYRQKNKSNQVRVQVKNKNVTRRPSNDMMQDDYRHNYNPAYDSYKPTSFNLTSSYNVINSRPGYNPLYSYNDKSSNRVRNNIRTPHHHPFLRFPVPNTGFRPEYMQPNYGRYNDRYNDNYLNFPKDIYGYNSPNSSFNRNPQHFSQYPNLHPFNEPRRHSFNEPRRYNPRNYDSK